MPWFYGIVVGIAVGVVVGALAERLPIAPLLQTLGAALAAVVLAAVALMFVFWKLPPRAAGSGGVGAVSAGISEIALLLGVPAFFAIAAGVHVWLGRLGAAAPWLAQHRAIVVACLAGVCGTMPVAWLMSAMVRAMDMD